MRHKVAMTRCQRNGPGAPPRADPTNVILADDFDTHRLRF
jgi:hypothetical protein